MRNLIFALALTLLLHESSGQKWRVSREKDKHLKSIEMLMEIKTDVNHLQSNKSHINRLVINSAYDDSIFISAAIENGINVTVRQDQSRTVESVKTNLGNFEQFTYDNDETFRNVENESAKLLDDKKLAKEINTERTKSLLESIKKLNRIEKHETRFQVLERKLQSHLSNLLCLNDDRNLEQAVLILEGSLNDTEMDERKIEKLDNVAANLTDLASKTKNLNLQKSALRVVEAYKTSVHNLKVTRSAEAIITRIVKSIRSEYFSSETAGILSNYINELNNLQQTLSDAKHVELVKQLKREIEEMAEAVNALSTASQVAQMEEKEFKQIAKNVNRLLDSLWIISESDLGIKYKTLANCLIRKLQKKWKEFKEKEETSSNRNQTEAFFKKVEKVSRMNLEEFAKVVQSVPSLKTELIKILSSDFDEVFRDRAEKFLKDLNSKWSNYEETVGKAVRGNATSEKEVREIFKKAEKLLELSREDFLKQEKSVPDLVELLKIIASSSLVRNLSESAEKFTFLIEKRLHDESDLSDVLEIFSKAEEILELNEKDFNAITEESEDIMRQLKLMSNSDLPKLHIEKSKVFLSKLNKRMARRNQELETREQQRWLEILSAINQTLTNPNGFAGKVGLKLMKNKLEEILQTVPDTDVEDKTKKLLKIVEAHEKKIDEILNLLQNLENKTRQIESDEELMEYKNITNQIKTITQQVNYPTVSRKSSELIARIQKEIEDYKEKKQINGIATVINKINNSPEKQEKEAYKPKSLKEKTSAVARKLPRRERKIVKRKDVLELLKIVNGYLNASLPNMRDQINNITRSFRNATENVVEKNSLRDRINSAASEYMRLKTGLQVIAKKLGIFKFNDDELRAKTEITNTNATSAKLLKLESLIDDDYTHDLVKKTFKLTQDVEHANDTLKQLRQMIVLNEKILTPSTKLVAVKDKPIKHVIVSIQRPSLNSSLSSIEAADKAVDLVEAAAENMETNKET